MSDDIINRINKLKVEKNATIMVHNYQNPEIQDIGDYVGDSLGLAQIAKKTDADVIVSCGVYFMAETSSMLCQDKTVLIPDANAGCDMANMITPAELQVLKDKHPEAVVVTYVNSTAQIKAMSDICCTSANAVKVVASIPRDKEVIFIPDRNLGRYVASKLGRELIIYDKGYCPVHDRMLLQYAVRAKHEYPTAKIVMHPEGRLDVLEMADLVASTTGILDYCKESKAREFIIGTEIGILHRLRKENPGKKFYPLLQIADCPSMKLVTLDKILSCLENMEVEVRVDSEIAAKGVKAIDRMLEVSV